MGASEPVHLLHPSDRRWKNLINKKSLKYQYRSFQKPQKTPPSAQLIVSLNSFEILAKKFSPLTKTFHIVNYLLRLLFYNFREDITYIFNPVERMSRENWQHILYGCQPDTRDKELKGETILQEKNLSPAKKSSRNLLLPKTSIYRHGPKTAESFLKLPTNSKEETE